MRTAITTAIAVLIVGGGTGATLAVSKKFSSSGSSSTAAYSTVKPGKGCGDKNHVHEREDECKKLK